MASAISNVSDKALACSFRVTEEAIHRFNNELDNIYILPLIETADVISIAALTMMKNNINGAGMILHIKPVTHIFALAING